MRLSRSIYAYLSLLPKDGDRLDRLSPPPISQSLPPLREFLDQLFSFLLLLRPPLLNPSLPSSELNQSLEEDLEEPPLLSLEPPL